MWNKPNKALNAPASNAANQPAKSGSETKPEVIVTPTAPVAAPIETKKI